MRPGELVQAVTDALSSETSSKAGKLLLGSIKQLKNARLKADPKLNEALVTIATENPQLFTGNLIIEVRPPAYVLRCYMYSLTLPPSLSPFLPFLFSLSHT